jgi:hypothetical protein
MNRRGLRFHEYDDILADVDSLLASGYDRAGQWSLGQMCHHTATVMEMSLDGFPGRLPWLFRAIARRFLLRKILRHHVFQRRFPAPKYIQPPDGEEDHAGVERLRAVLGRLKTHSGPMKPSPLFGTLTPEEWRELHLWHCEHHLGYLHPKQE